MKSSSAAASTMLISDSRLTPASSPATTETSAMAVMHPISTTLAVSVASIPNRKSIPPIACSAPKPSEVASPNSVAKTAIVSITWPGQPQTRSPKIG